MQASIRHSLSVALGLALFFARALRGAVRDGHGERERVWSSLLPHSTASWTGLAAAGLACRSVAGAARQRPWTGAAATTSRLSSRGGGPLRPSRGRPSTKRVTTTG